MTYEIDSDDLFKALKKEKGAGLITPLAYTCPICGKPALTCNKEDFNCNCCEPNEVSGDPPCNHLPKDLCHCGGKDLIEYYLTENDELKQRVEELEEVIAHEVGIAILGRKEDGK
jgi:hypothetical protein